MARAGASGFQISSPPYFPMLGAGSFGHTGAGGQLAFGDIDHGASFAYLTNQMGGFGDRRATIADRGPAAVCSMAEPAPAGARRPIRPKPAAAADVPGLARRRSADVTALLDGPLDGLFRGVHILPPFPSIGRPRVRADHLRRIDPGSDAGPTRGLAGRTRSARGSDIEPLASSHDVLLDVMVNHISRHSPEFQAFARGGRRRRPPTCSSRPTRSGPTASRPLTTSRVCSCAGAPARSRRSRPDDGERGDASGPRSGKARCPSRSTSTSRRRRRASSWRAGSRFLAEHGVAMVRLDAVGYVIKKAGHLLLHGRARDLRVPRLGVGGGRRARPEHPARGPRRARDARAARRPGASGPTTSCCPASSSTRCELGRGRATRRAPRASPASTGHDARLP